MVKEKRTIKAKAKVNLKYDKDIVKNGGEFLIRKSDVDAVKDYAEILTKIEPEDPSKDPEGDPNNEDNEE